MQGLLLQLSRGNGGLWSFTLPLWSLVTQHLQQPVATASGNWQCAAQCRSIHTGDSSSSFAQPPKQQSADGAAPSPPSQIDQPSHTSSSSSGSGSSTRTQAAASSSLDKREAAKFAALADHWWDAAAGPFAALHALNTARCSFLRQGLCSMRGLSPSTAEPLAGLRVLDVGCGGGLLSEPLARMGATVTGIDVSAQGVAAAAAHAAGDPLLTQRITYQQTTLEDLVAARGAAFDVVMASEVIEHVKQPQQFMQSLAAAAVPGGQVFVTTLNRTPASYALAILGAEYLLRLVPAGTHSWTKFITPQELAMMATDAGLRMQLMAGMVLQPGSGQFALSDGDLSVNYAALMQKE